MLSRTAPTGPARFEKILKHTRFFGFRISPDKSGKPQQVLTVELRNGTQDTLSPSQAGLTVLGTEYYSRMIRGPNSTFLRAAIKPITGESSRPFPALEGLSPAGPLVIPLAPKKTVWVCPKSCLSPSKSAPGNGTRPKTPKLPTPASELTWAVPSSGSRG